ncbi:hypothetical protein VQL36_08795 [Chengkuizengella sp. SCS-71B]|uniref:hypothetical protein n=1 Tax=Chengkuizengella sp. SCS-71B TaxID=3115290 RepID=UPI0032C21E58
MTKIQRLSLPKELETFREQIQNRVKPYIQISTKKRSTTIHQNRTQVHEWERDQYMTFY